MSRYYDPETALDSAEYLEPTVPNGVDLYAYCRYNPVMKIDPTGTNVADDISSAADWIQLVLKMAIGVIRGLSKTLPNVGYNAKSFDSSLNNFGNSLSNGFTVFSYIMIGVSNIIDGINEGKTALNIATDIIFDCTAIAICSQIGAAIGSIIPIGGTIIGGLIGAGLGFIYSYFSDSQIIQELKEALYEGVNTIVTDFVRIGNNISYAFDSFANQIWDWVKGIFA